MLRATNSPGNCMVRSNLSPPAPRVPGVGGAAKVFQSRTLWQSMHTHTWLARYSPRATRSGVTSTVRSSGTGTLGNAWVTYRTAPPKIRMMITRRPIRTLSTFFMVSGIGYSKFTDPDAHFQVPYSLTTLATATVFAPWARRTYVPTA